MDDDAVSGKAAAYQPTAGDLRYRNAFSADPDINEFEEARLLRDVSDEYLSVLSHDNSGDRSAPFRAMLDAERQRRSNDLARRANRLASWSLVVALGALVVSIVGIL